MFIYVIVNSETLKLYVGQHKGKNLRQYLQQKLSEARRGFSGRSHLYASMRKHPDKAAWSIHPLAVVETKAEVDELEKHFIRVLKAQHKEVGYNICRGGEGHTGPLSAEGKRKLREAYAAHFGIGHGPAQGNKHTDEWKKQASIRARQYKPTEATKQKTSATLMGHGFSEESLRKMSENRKGQCLGAANHFFGKHHSEESKRRNSEAHRKPWTAARRAAQEAKS